MGEVPPPQTLCIQPELKCSRKCVEEADSNNTCPQVQRVHTDFEQFFLCKTDFFVQFAQNWKYYTKRNFLGKLSKINILSNELTTEDLFNYYIQKKY